MNKKGKKREERSMNVSLLGSGGKAEGEYEWEGMEAGKKGRK